MVPQLAYRFLQQANALVLWKYLYRFAWSGFLSIRRFRKAKQRGCTCPPFVFFSATNRCSLRCQGCWVSTRSGDNDMPVEMMERIVTECKEVGNRFYGILGGEPLLHEDLLPFFSRHRDCYFQLFTNGQSMTQEVAKELASYGNVTPLVSLEGLDTVSDQRRGGSEVYEKTLRGIDACVQAGLITGVATSVCRNNIHDLVREQYLDDMVRRGVLYVWYYIYRPVGPRPTPELALTRGEILRLRRFLVEQRCKWPIAIIDSYWDEKGKAFCPAARGLSVHINPFGDVEPCPPVQVSGENIEDDDDIPDLLANSTFLHDFANISTQVGNGCILMDDPESLLELVKYSDARDTTGRDGVAEISGMAGCCSHDLPSDEIPEKHWLYRWAKKQAFFGLGAYG